jgi:hypothetical protein
LCKEARSIYTKEGHFGDALKKENGVEDIVVASTSRGLPRLSPISHLEHEAGHRHETVKREKSKHHRQHINEY